jgi:quinol monooxygenase YgiN
MERQVERPCASGPARAPDDTAAPAIALPGGYARRPGRPTDPEDTTMILVIGDVFAREDTIARARALALGHVRRSRGEPGCLSHAVHHDVEDPLHLVFVERWADAESLAQHFAVPESRAFVRAIGALCARPPRIDVYDAETLEGPRLGGRTEE